MPWPAAPPAPPRVKGDGAGGNQHVLDAEVPRPVTLKTTWLLRVAMSVARAMANIYNLFHK
jgi:hypothetical protein